MNLVVLLHKLITRRQISTSGLTNRKIIVWRRFGSNFTAQVHNRLRPTPLVHPTDFVMFCALGGPTV